VSAVPRKLPVRLKTKKYFIYFEKKTLEPTMYNASVVVVISEVTGTDSG
jgi:hypothetical protein